MSEPTIWDIAMGGNPPEKFVPYAEYAQLKAEVQTLRHQAVHDVSQLGEQSAEIANLKAEVERLRKAGDWLPIESAPRDGSYFIGGVWGDMESRPTWATMCHYYVSGKRFEMQETCDQPDFWIPLPNAPKEGKPSV